MRLNEYSKHRCAICIMQNIPHTKFLECLIDVGSKLGPFVPDFEVPVLKCLKAIKEHDCFLESLLFSTKSVSYAVGSSFLLSETLALKYVCKPLIYSL